jgi:hypothetical protein
LVSVAKFGHFELTGQEDQGQVYKSLSAAAKAITGSHTSGYFFFRRALAGRGGNA